MPIIESAKKRVRVTKKRTEINKQWKEKYKNAIRSYLEVIEEGNVDKAEEQLRETKKIIDKTAAKGIIHKNKASRKKSQLTKMYNNIK